MFADILAGRLVAWTAECREHSGQQSEYIAFGGGGGGHLATDFEVIFFH